MQTVLKLAVSLAVILAATETGKKLPSMAGLIATMPLTGLLVMVWLYVENDGDGRLMTQYVKGAVWGILPSILFFLTAWLAFRKQLSLPLVLAAGLGVWLAGAFVHQWFMKG